MDSTHQNNAIGNEEIQCYHKSNIDSPNDRIVILVSGQVQVGDECVQQCDRQKMEYKIVGYLSK